ncbi:MAG: HAD-IIB family hydrolase [Candidatus Saccharimonadales bacterium]
MKKVIAFDLDDTLAVSKSAMSDRMATLLGNLSEKYQICIISGGKFEQFQMQVIDRLEIPHKHLIKFHMMPTCGTRYYRFDVKTETWQMQYAEDLSAEQKQEIIEILEEEAKKVDLKNPKKWGPVIEDRQSQISYSILGQKAPPEEKYKWAEKHTDIKKLFHARVAERLPDLEVRLGGQTTIDITRLGIDKAYGMQKLIEKLGISKRDVLFIGDKLQEGGNDYPVKAMGIDSIEVDGWEDTACVVEGILGVS